ncbi:MAG: sulfur carrier protein ThiS [Solirubrobacterales bacterium]|jgi:sulfur carrier protein|nr:sulfur carrier protein ThiS [Solirubrobacterales bacterium]
MIRVNGEPAAVDDGTTVTALLEAIDAPPRGVAVAVDGEVIPRTAWPSTPLPDGARVEVLSAMQGG